MPELPDLEVFKTNIYKRLTSKRLMGLKVYNKDKVALPEATLQMKLAGRELRAVERAGKELFFDFGDHKVVAVHLMLNGKISIVGAAEAEEITHKIFVFNFLRETLVFSDIGGLCMVRYTPANKKIPDAFDTSFTLAYFLEAAHKNATVNVKSFLTDQSVIKGIGSAYADEILWAARISPYSMVGSIPDETLATLHESIGSVLRDAVEFIKLIAPNIISGEERSFLNVHNRNRKTTETGFPIKTGKIASKTTYFTEEQVLYT